MIPYDELHLLPAELKLLKCIRRCGRLVISSSEQDAYRKLQGYGLVFKPYESVPDGFGSCTRLYHPECVLTDEGNRYLSYLDEKSKSASRQSRRYWITTSIALVSLIKAFWPEISGALASLCQLLSKQP